jgi:hypothetical protein
VIARFLDGLAARWLWRRVRPHDDEALAVRVVWPRRRWCIAVIDAPDVPYWYGQPPVPLTDWSVTELETWLESHPDPT